MEDCTFNDDDWNEQLAKLFVDLVQLRATSPHAKSEFINTRLNAAIQWIDGAVDKAFGHGFASLLTGYACTDGRVELDDLIDIWGWSDKGRKGTEDQEGLE